MKNTQKRVLAFAMTLLMVLSAIVTGVPAVTAYAASAVTVQESDGWFESAYVKWSEVSGAKSYQVYVKQASAADSAYVQLDDELIRKYPTYWRADALGLKAGSYVLKIEAIASGSVIASTVTDAVTVSAYDRSGFTFSSNSPVASTGVGAYNNDGTLKSNAKVLYVTEANKESVKMTIKGTEYTGVAAITQAIKDKNNCEPVAIRIIGQVTMDGLVCSDLSSAYAIGVKAASNVTFEGVGDDATLYTAGVAAFSSKSIEIRNLGLMNWGGGKDGDGISLKATVGAWIHNCDFFYGNAGSDGDQAKGDGSMDLKDDSQYVTISYNHFWDSGKMSLCGMKSESGENWITYHHNWFDHSDSRHPRIRKMTVHVYNNYFDGNAKYGIGVTYGGNVFAEANYFRNCPYPFLISSQGADTVADGILSGETGGAIKAYNNVFVGTLKSLTYSNVGSGTAGATKAASSTDYDAYLATSRTENVPSTYQSKSGSFTYSNFDTTVDLGVATSAIDMPSDIPSVVTSKAGRMNQGDFQWSFDNSKDDASYALNSELKSAINTYKTALVSVGGGDTGATAETEYTISVTNGSASTTQAAAGTKITITANAVSGKTFSGWTVNSSNVSLASATSATTTFTMPSGNVTVTANYSDNSGSGDNGGSGSTELPSGDMVYSVTDSGVAGSSFYTITSASLKSESIQYNGATLTKGIKMESSTNISFNAPSAGKLTMVFNDGSSLTVKVDNKAVDIPAGGVLTVELAAGEHAITKGTTNTYLYYLAYVTDGSGSETTDPETPDAHVHTYDQGVVTKVPTATEPGEKTYTCTGCAEGTEGHSYTEEIPALGGGSGEVELGEYKAVTIPSAGLVTDAVYGNAEEVKFTVFEDMKQNAEQEISGYTNYYQGSTNPTIGSNGVPTGGAVFKIEAVKNAQVKFVVRNVGKTTDGAKTYYVVDAKGNTLASASMGTGEIKAVTVSFDVAAGETYYFYVKSSKVMVLEFGYAAEGTTQGDSGEGGNTEPEVPFTGIALNEEDVWCYYFEGSIATDFTGLVRDSAGNTYYVENGVVNFEKNGFADGMDGNWYYFRMGEVATDLTGYCCDAVGKEYYLDKGVVDFSKPMSDSYTGVTDAADGNWYYYFNGRIAEEFTGLTTDWAGNTYYIEQGKVNFEKEGFADGMDGSWYYFRLGAVATDLTGWCTDATGAEYWVVAGRVDFSQTN